MPPQQRMPTAAEIAQLRMRAKGGDQLAQHMLNVVESMNAGGIPIGGTPEAPPGFKVLDPSKIKIHPLPCGACGSKLFEKVQYAEAFYDENDPSHQWLGKPTPVTLCARCGSEQVITTIKRQGSDPSEPEVRYEYSTRTFKVGIQQIQQILAEQRVQMVNQVADVIDQHFGKDRETEATELMLKIGKEFGLKPDPEEAKPSAASVPAPEPEQVAPKKSSIILEE